MQHHRHAWYACLASARSPRSRAGRPGHALGLLPRDVIGVDLDEARGASDGAAGLEACEVGRGTAEGVDERLGVERRHGRGGRDVEAVAAEAIAEGDVGGGDPDAAAALADAVVFARDLVAEPANIVYPESFVDRTRAAFAGVAGVRIEVLDVAAMEKLGMGAILSVGKGSVRPPRLLVVEYKGAGAPAKPIVLPGKGITFDSGGISLKGGNGMWRMKNDMAGAAAVVGSVLALARGRAPVNVVAIAALAENMPDGGASRPGDVVRAMNGKTIEIISTDAEGRLVLADALAYAEKRYDPAAIVDVATLTGAVGGALGNEYAGLFSRHDALAEQLLAAGRATGEELWRLPLHANHLEDIKSDYADIRNSTEGNQPGASHGAAFIGHFADAATPWAHLDIAATALSSEATPTVPKGAVGYGVQLLDRFVRDFKAVN